VVDCGEAFKIMADTRKHVLSSEDKAQLKKAAEAIKAGAEKARKIAAGISNLDKAVEDLDKALQ
jgi:hypothetical protein